jgi:hypothetical protein
VVITLRLTPPWAVRCFTAAEDFLESRRKWPKHAALWARALGASVAGLALSAATTADVPAARIRPIAAVAAPADPRIARLEKFFRSYRCPAPYHTADYLRAADGYGLDYRLLPAVSIRESRCGAAETQQHNHWGYHPGRQSFPSIEAGIDFVAQRLTQHKLYKGKTLEDKLFTYNPRSAYPGEVQRIMRQIE